jgi:hypothetical protein
MPGQVPPAAVLPPDHQLGMVVPKGGSMCANCGFLKDPQNCGNQGFIIWNGSPQLPAPPDQYCCDLYQPRGNLAQGAQQPPQAQQTAVQQPPQGGPPQAGLNPQMMLKALQG